MASQFKFATDTTPPSTPTNLIATPVSTSQINLSWTLSTDNVGVAEYRIERCQGASCTNFGQIATSTTTSYQNTGLSAGTAYRYRVLAVDAAGNVSSYSTIASATTQAAGDTTAPSVPSNLVATAISTSQINLTWTASTDNIGVTGYRIERCSGAGCSSFIQIDTPVSPSYSDIGLSPSTSYSYRVRATDAAGNLSGYSSTATAVTQTSSGTGTQSFQLTSTQTGTLPFMVALGFKKGDVGSGPVLTGISNYQCTVKRTWNDGSIKHVVIAGRAALTANVALTITAANGTAQTGTNLTSASIAAAAPTASVQCGALGTVSLSSLLASPFRTWISGHEMVECHYRSAVGSDTSLNVWFHVRLYADGRMWIRAIVENGYLDQTTSNKSYVPTIIIGGTTVYNNGGAALSHFAFTRYSAEGWIGGDPLITPKHDAAYLRASKLVPNYWKTNPSTAKLNSLIQTYTPMSNGSHTLEMHFAGFQEAIGLLPTWDALYCTSTDPRAYRSVLANASHLNSYPMTWRDSVTKLIPTPSAYPNYAIDGGTFLKFAGTKEWEMNHHPSMGYLAYLITGDYWYYETLAFGNAINYLALGPGRGAGLNRILSAETRGTAWNMRTITQFCALTPTGDAVGAEYQTLLTNNITHWKAIMDTCIAAGRNLGYIHEYSVDLYATGTVAPWQQHFFEQSMGLGSDIEPLSDMTNFNIVRNHMYKGAVGITGNATAWYFTYGASYNAKISTGGNTNNPEQWFSTWLDAWNASVAASGSNPNLPTGPASGNTLLGSSGSLPSLAEEGYWGNMLPALIYAVDHGATGAQASYNRLTGANNWSDIENAGFDDIPNWGITPRATTPSGPLGWTQLPNTKLVSVAPPNNFGGDSYQFLNNCAGVINAWNSAAFDSSRNRLIVWGGGHNDYAGNEVYAMNLATNTFTRLNNPAIPTNFGGSCSVLALGDGSPNVRHTYDSLAYIAVADRMFMFGGSKCCAAGDMANDTWTLNLATLQWQSMNPSGPIPRADPGIVTAYDPNTGKVYLHDAVNLYTYTYSTNTFAKVGPNTAIDYHLTAVIDPVRQKLVILGNNEAWFYDISSGSSFVRQTLTTSGGSAVISALYPGLAYNPVTDRIVAWVGGDTVYSLNLDTNTWTPTTHSGGPGAAQTNGTMKRFSYSAASGVFVVVNAYNQDAFTLRLT